MMLPLLHPLMSVLMNRHFETTIEFRSLSV
nr:MAG TPA: hypothetical protein [Bacteriophage sp.]